MPEITWLDFNLGKITLAQLLEKIGFYFKASLWYIMSIFLMHIISETLLKFVGAYEIKDLE